MFGLFRRIRARLKYRHFDRDLAREIDVHRAMKREELGASNNAPDDARFEATRVLGNVTYMREEARSMWIARWLEHLWQDLRYAARCLRRQPGFSLAVILILATGVGSLTTAYSTLNATMLRPWQVPGVESVFLVRARPGPQQQFGGLSFDEVLYLNEHSRTLQGLSTFVGGGEQIDATGPSVQSTFVTSNYFNVLGVPVTRGPGFTPGGENVPLIREVVISERLWRDYFGSDPAVAGRSIRLSEARPPAQPFTVVGVAGLGFEGVNTARIDLWTSIATLGLSGAGRPGGAVVGRLAAGVTRDQALAELEGLSRRFRYANEIPAFGLTLTDTRPISVRQPQMLRLYALVFMGLGLILLLTCANVGSLLLARSLARQREVAVRLSLGASRWRVARQFLTEALVLALCAGAFGVVLAAAWPKFILTMSGNTLLRTTYLAPDVSVVGMALLLSIVAAGLAGCSAALRVKRVSLSQMSAQRHGPDREARVARSVLLATQVAVTAVFLTGAGMVGRSVVVAAASDPGFATEGISVVSVEFKEKLSAARRSEFARTLANSIPDASQSAIAFAAFRPLIKGASTIVRVHQPHEHANVARWITHRPVSSNYFSLMQIPIVDGRAPAPGSEGMELVLSEMAARALWPDGSAVGRTLTKLGSKGESATVTVVGVAGDVPTGALGRLEPIAYSQSSSLPLALVRTGTPDALESLRSISRGLESSAVLTVTPMRQIVRDSFSEVESASRILWMVGAAALFIAALGIFGVFSYGVEERRREIGIRIALGGRAFHVGLQVLRSGQRAAAIGGLVGFVICMVGASFAQHSLFGLRPFDVVAYGQVAVMLGATTMLALWIPARRAARVDPAVTLRCD